MARMIYHVPYPLTPHAKTGSGLRPMRMLEAFRDIGYDVELVSGESRERRVLIKALKKRIAAGESFDFLYSESHTMPTALTDADHLPRHPFMDVAFLRFARRNGIKVGLFYRDVYWRFPEYKERLNPVVHTATRALYHLDLVAYKAAVDTLYMPSLGMGKFVPHVPVSRHKALPPGGDIVDAPSTEREGVHLLYVGGLGGYYSMHGCVQAVAASKNAWLTICTREDEWERNAHEYRSLMNDRIQVVHKNGTELVPYYEQADICMLFIEPSIYRSFAAPIKFAEYIGFGKPVIVNTGTNVAQFVGAHDNGWAVPFKPAGLTALLDDLAGHREKIAAITNKVLQLREDNTWTTRARQVASDLSPTIST
ncbi:glycosyltransferase [Arthrobacter cryoconiti]|uniref:Glycosyltransferase n=1 Tax=Arthrobacter cryoconiti TaxID=748907 RepID=A0ABV8QWY8_9MICC|nr:glycosyltransferase [Arthrobacter cryoconiti]MCC9069010.1 glycosyltransferase [Arthrobacter cryoconiti]